MHVLRNYLKPSRATLIAVNVYFFENKQKSITRRSRKFFKPQLIIFSQFGATIFSLSINSHLKDFFCSTVNSVWYCMETAHLYVRWSHTAGRPTFNYRGVDGCDLEKRKEAIFLIMKFTEKWWIFQGILRRWTWAAMEEKSEVEIQHFLHFLGARSLKIFLRLLFSFRLLD